LKRKFLFWIKRILLAFAILLGMEAAFFAYILSREPKAANTEIVVVFDGSVNRVAEGFGLANAVGASGLIISPASQHELEEYQMKFGPLHKTALILEDKARTTFENSFLAKNIIKKRKPRCITLVTDALHMPRSYLLLRIQLAGENISIARHRADRKLSGTVHAKLFYNELVKTWGSLGEMLSADFRGRLPQENPKDSPVLKSFKKLLLFDLRDEPRGNPR
jgi:uncharacterized SAM-binding protein YcdF (DUF218 family)